VVGLFLGLAASLSWGSADFLGAVEARRLRVMTVLLMSQPVGLALATAWALSAGGHRPPLVDLAVAASAGLVGAVGLGALFAAMARGAIGIASPIAATGVLAPLAYGLARGESPSVLALAGAALAITGILLAARSSDRRDGRDGLSLLFAAGAAVGFGAMFVGVAFAARRSAPWAVCSARAGGFAAIGSGALLSRRAPEFAGRDLPRLASIGALDVLGSCFYALGAHTGRISLTAVAASLYPAVTVSLAAGFLGERMTRIQRVGMAVALIGITAIATGS
jgi:drug/metabolite transporter (DMT)-like permease